MRLFLARFVALLASITCIIVVHTLIQIVVVVNY